MAMLIGVVVLGALLAVCVYGFVTESRRAEALGSRSRTSPPGDA